MTEDERIEKGGAFLKEYGELVEKHQMDLATYPVFIPDGQGGFKVTVQSTPVPLPSEAIESPFMEKE